MYKIKSRFYFKIIKIIKISIFIYRLSDHVVEIIVLGKSSYILEILLEYQRKS